MHAIDHAQAKSRSAERIQLLEFGCLHPRMDDEPDWKRRAEAVEYWALTALLAGSLFYGIMIGLYELLTGKR